MFKKGISVSDVMVQDGERYDDILHRELFNVNIRLLNINAEYCTLITSIIKYMESIFKIYFRNYAKIKGLSCANIGIPFNIITIDIGNGSGIIKHERRQAKHLPKILTMINPIITKTFKKTIEVKSNCGSLCLPESIKVRRHKQIEIEYYNALGVLSRAICKQPISTTIQHEIDHNSGILISDIETKKRKHIIYGNTTRSRYVV